MRYLQWINSPQGGNSVRVIAGTASRWEQLATALLIDYQDIECVGRDHQECTRACRKVLIMWLEGNWRLPVTWATLTDSLREAQFVAIADSLEAILT